MAFRLRHIAFLVFGLLYPLLVRANAPAAPDSLQMRFNAFSLWCSPEKVYLHYDRSCYTAGEKIWFKGWVQDASLFSTLPPSNFLYAEVLDGHGTAVVRVKIKRSGDGFPGCIELPDVMETGNYTIRAYTLWQLNSGSEYLFSDRIRIIGEGGKKDKKAQESSGHIDVSFWPEGGRYFAGHSAVIGFKVTNRLGKSVNFSGFLVNDQDSQEIPVVTTHDGMGAFSFLPLSGRRYSLRDASGKSYPLPQPSEDGATLQLRVRSGRYYISAIGFGGGEASLLVRDASELRPLAGIRLDGTVGSLVMEKSFFRPGINHFLLVNSQGNILAERLFFIRDSSAPVCKLEMEQFVPAPRALTKGTVSICSPDGTPLKGSCSVSVVRGALKDWQQTDGIASYMGLSSELKGKINNPYYYFDPDIPERERNSALDILMMIQGWRYYDLEKISSGGSFKIRHKRERVQELRGHVSRKFSSRIPDNFIITFLSPQLGIVNSVNVERGRYFIIDSLDFQENTEMLINIGRSRKGAGYLPRWDGDTFAPPYVYLPAPGASKEAGAVAPMFSELASDNTLDAAVVTASYEDSDVLSFGRSFREDLLFYKDMTLVEYVSMKKAVFEYDGENMYNRSSRHRLSSGSSDDDSSDSFDLDREDAAGLVKLIVGDTEESWWGYDMLRLEDLRSISISTNPDPVYGGDGGVVHINVKPGSLRRDTERNPSLLYFVPLGHQVPRYFESPRYDRGDSVLSDKRNTVWWSPSVPLSNGFGKIEFCNNDLADYPYVIRIEGLTSDGRPFSLHRLVSPHD